MYFNNSGTEGRYLSIAKSMSHFYVFLIIVVQMAASVYSRKHEPHKSIFKTFDKLRLNNIISTVLGFKKGN